MFAINPSNPFRILILEDEQDILDMLASLIASQLPDTVIDGAITVAQANAFIDALAARRQQHNLAILDFKVPADIGIHEEFDFTVCQKLDRQGVPIVHVSVHLGDERILAHMRTAHPPDRLPGSPLASIAKDTEGKWAVKVCQIVQEGYGRFVSTGLRTRLESIFGRTTANTGGTARWALGSATRGEDLCGTHAFIQLHTDIVRQWRFLDSDVQAQVRSIFAIVDLDRPDPRLSLFPKES